MYTQQVSVYELKKTWEGIVERQNVGLIPLRRMPPWNDICSELGWEPHLIDSGYFSKKRHGYCGVYRLVGLAAENDFRKPARLSRVCGDDPTGTLYIGETRSLNKRLNMMRLFTHNAIQMLERLPLRGLFPANKLAIALLITDCSMTSFVERNLLQAYMNSFGDTPPLNYRL